MNPQLFQQPFFAVALPIMFAILIASWNQNKRSEDTNKRVDDLNHAMTKRMEDLNVSVTKRMEDLNVSLTKRMEDLSFSLNNRMDDLSRSINGRLDDIIHRLGRIESKMENHDDRLVRLEERTSPIGRASR